MLDSSPDVRDSIASLARRIDRGGMDALDLKSALDELDDLLMEEIDGRHR